MARDNVIEVKIIANDSALSAGMDQAAETVQTATASMNESAEATAETTAEAADGISGAFSSAAASVSESLTAIKAQLASVAESTNLTAGEVGSAMSGMGALIGAGFAGEYLSRIQDSEIRLAHLSDATGMTVSTLAEMKGAMQQSGVDTKRFSDTMARLAEHLNMAREGSKQEMRAFEALGITSQDLANKNFGVKDALMRVADYLHQNGGSSQALGQAYLLLGRQAVELTGWLNQGSDAIAKQMKSLTDLGQASQNAVSSALKMRQEEAQLSQQMKTAMLPAFEGLVKAVEAFGTSLDFSRAWFGTWVDYIENAIQGTIETFSKLGAVVSDLFHHNFEKMKVDATGAANAFRDAMSSATADASADWHKFHQEFTATWGGTPAENHAGVGAAMPLGGGAAGHGSRGSGADIFGAVERATRESARRIEQENHRLMASVDAAMRKMDALDQHAARTELARMKATEQANAIMESADEKHQVAMLKMKQSELNDELRLGKITADEKIALEEALQQKIFDIQKAALQKRISELSQHDPNYPVEKARLDAQIESLEDQHQAKMLEIEQKAEVKRQQLQKNSQKEWEKGFQVISRAFEQSMMGIMRGTQTIGEAFARMGDSIAASWIQSMEKQLMTFVETHLLMKAIGQQTAQASISQHAASAAAGAWDATVGIPIVGPVLAPIAAATSFAGVEAFSAMASAAGGQWEVPGVQATMLHPQEMVLPAPLAEGLRRTVTGGGGGGSVHLHVHATDADSVQRLFERNGRTLARVLQQQVRLGALT